VKDRCPGVPREVVQRFGAPRMTPVTTDRARRRLSLIATVEEQVARELVQPSHYRDVTQGRIDEDLIRVVFQCNQSCRFCFVSTHLPGADDAAIESAIRHAAARDHKINLTGGEPTLHPRLTDFVRLAKSLSQRPVILQPTRSASASSSQPGSTRSSCRSTARARPSPMASQARPAPSTRPSAASISSLHKGCRCNSIS
jgi:hypothetical protein